MYCGIKGKTAVVTGAAQGIGEATARLFAENGAKVVLFDMKKEKGEETVSEIRAARGEAVFFHGDVTKEEDLKEMVQFAIDTYGGLNFAANCAGVNPPFHKAADYTFEEMQKAFAINYFGIFFAAKYEIAAMLKIGGGSVVNISSGCGLRGKYGVAAYTAAKHAICGFSKCAALDYARENIRVNCICPGVTNTPMFAQNRNRDPAAYQHLVEQNPMMRMMDPSEIAHPTVWLCSDGASSVNGVEFVVDGGAYAR